MYLKGIGVKEEKEKAHGEVLAGNLPKAKMKLVQAWLEIHKEDLLAN